MRGGFKNASLKTVDEIGKINNSGLARKAERPRSWQAFRSSPRQDRASRRSSIGASEAQRQLLEQPGGGLPRRGYRATIPPSACHFGVSSDALFML